MMSKICGRKSVKGGGLSVSHRGEGGGRQLRTQYKGEYKVYKVHAVGFICVEISLKHTDVARSVV